MLQLPHLKKPESHSQSQQRNDEHPSKNSTLKTSITMCLRLSKGLSFKLGWLSWHLWLYYLISEQSTGSGFTEGIAPCGNPNKQGIFTSILHTVLLEFCSCLRDLKRKKNPERKLIHSQASIKHFLLKSYCQTELECSQVTSQILEHQVYQHRSRIYKALMKHIWNTMPVISQTSVEDWGLRLPVWCNFFALNA